jgi:hypothetical protein
MSPEGLIIFKFIACYNIEIIYDLIFCIPNYKKGISYGR